MKDTDTTDTAQGAPPFPPIALSEEEWLDYFDEVEATEAEKLELVRTLWSMMLTFVDLHWQCQPIPETSGQLPQLTDVLRRAVVDLGHDKEGV